MQASLRTEKEGSVGLKARLDLALEQIRELMKQLGHGATFLVKRGNELNFQHVCSSTLTCSVQLLAGPEAPACGLAPM